MKILITHFFSKKNKGDAAIVSVMIAELKRVFNDAEIAISITDPLEGESAEFEGAPLVLSPLYSAIYPHKQSWRRILMTSYVASSTLLWALLKKFLSVRADFILTNDLRKVMHVYADAEMIIPCGGCYITGNDSRQSDVTIAMHLHAILLALILNKSVYMFSQSIGPFGNGFQKYITGIILNRVKLIFAREEFTIQTLKEMKVSDELIIKSNDVAFLFSPNTKEKMALYLAEKGVDLNHEKVGITLRKFLPPREQEIYEAEISKFIEWLGEKRGLQVIVIPQVTSTLQKDDDREVAARLIVNDRCLVISDDLGHREIKGIYENMDWFIGTRMHSCIFSLTANIPTIAIEYQYKTSGIMKDLGLEDWVIRVEDVRFDVLAQKFDSLRENREEYLKALARNLPAYKSKARNVADELKKSYLALETSAVQVREWRTT